MSSSSTVQAPHWPRPQPNWRRAGRVVAQHVEQRLLRVPGVDGSEAPLTMSVKVGMRKLLATTNGARSVLGSAEDCHTRPVASMPDEAYGSLRAPILGREATMPAAATMAALFALGPSSGEIYRNEKAGWGHRRDRPRRGARKRTQSWAGSRLGARLHLAAAGGRARRARLSPLLDVEGRLYWLFMSEDGYLMQTIARNMATGLGMSTAKGTMPTNGVQPLATFLYAGLHALAGGSKMLAIGYVTVFATAVSAAAAWVFWRLGQSVLRDLPFARDIALLAAALWFASPSIIGHSMNGLETGLYYLAITMTLVYYFSLDLSAPAPMRAGQRVALGPAARRHLPGAQRCGVLHRRGAGRPRAAGWRLRGRRLGPACGRRHGGGRPEPGRRFALAGLQQVDVRIGGADQRLRAVACGGLRCQSAHDPGQPGRGLLALRAHTAGAGNCVAGGRRRARRARRARVGGRGRWSAGAACAAFGSASSRLCFAPASPATTACSSARRSSSRATCRRCRPCCGC